MTDAGRPYLGLCLGLQLLFEEGEEHGTTPGLGVFRGRVTRFPNEVKDERGQGLRCACRTSAGTRCVMSGAIP